MSTPTTLGSCACGGKYFDFVSFKVAVPINSQAWGWDGTFSNTGVSDDGFPRWVFGGIEPDWSKQWYGTVTTTWTFNDGSVQVDTVKAYPYFGNPADTTAIALGIPGSSANSLNPADDVRLTGFPGGGDSTDSSVTTPGRFNPPGSKDIDVFGDHITREDHQGPGGGPTPPVVTPTSTLIYCEGNDNPTGGTADMRWLIHFHTEVSDGSTLSGALGAVSAALPALGTGMTIREGPVFFDFYGPTSTYFPLNVISAGSVYASDGTFTLPNLNPKMLYGITLGLNDGESFIDGSGSGWSGVFPDYTGSRGPTDNLTVGLVFPYHWPDGASYNFILTSNISSTDIDHGTFPTLKYSTCFCSLTGVGVRLGGGHPPPVTAAWTATTAYTLGDLVVDSSVACRMQKVTVAGTSGGATPAWTGTTTTDGGVTWTAVAVPVTAIVSSTHVRSLTFFPLRLGGVFTAQIGTQRNVASDIPSGFIDFSGHLDGLIRESSRLLVPANPAALIAAWVDPFHFTDINNGSPPTLQLMDYQIQIQPWGSPATDANTDVIAFNLLPPGQTVVNYTNVGALFGYIFFGSLADVRMPIAPATPAGAGGSGRAGGFGGAGGSAGGQL